MKLIIMERNDEGVFEKPVGQKNFKKKRKKTCLLD
jgi:hypothetical protein